MKKVIILTYILLSISFIVNAQPPNKGETTEIESKKFDFDINKVALFLNIVDEELQTPLKVDNVNITDANGKTYKAVKSKKSGPLKVWLPINNTYNIKVINNKYETKSFTHTVDKKVSDYETSRTINMIPLRVPITVSLPEEKHIKPEDMEVVATNQGSTKTSKFTYDPSTKTYTANLREGENYDLEIRDQGKNFIYTKRILASSSNKNVPIASDKLSRLKPPKPAKIDNNTNNSSNIPPNYDPRNPNPNNNNVLGNEENAENLENADNEENTEPEVKEIIKEVPEVEPIDKKADSYEDILRLTNEQIEKDGKDLVEKREKMQIKLDELKNYIDDNELTAKQKNKIADYIKDMEERMAYYDELYKKIRQKNLQSVSDIKLQLGVRESFWKRFWYIIVIFAIILAIMFIVMVIFYFIARNRRKQRDNLQNLYDQIDEEKKKSDDLLLNILPLSIANELKANGVAKMRSYERVSILFTDFKGFTQVASKMKPDKLMEELNDCFTAFDRIIAGHNMEKIKTIGDAYMCAGGIPEANEINPLDAVMAGLEMQAFMVRRRKEKLAIGDDYWRCRLGINTGEIRAGVIGTSKFAYDIWGDPVNIASRMESGGEVNKVNISNNTYDLIKDFFDCTYRGEVEVKNGLVLKMYFVDRVKPELSADEEGLKPNEAFEKLKREQFGTTKTKQLT